MQRGKRTSRFPMPLLLRVIDLAYRIQATSTRFRHQVETVHAALSRSAAAFRLRARQWTNSEARSRRKRIRAEEERRRLMRIGRRLTRTI